MQRFRGQDAQFLYNETPTSPFVTLKVLIYEPCDPEVKPSFAEFKAFIAAGVSDWIQKGLGFRVLRSPFDLHHPVWIEDKNFRLDNHIHHIALPSPGDKDALCRFVSYIMSMPLDPNRPLWDSWMVEGLEGGKIAWVCKMHHCLADGMMSADHIINIHSPKDHSSTAISSADYVFKHSPPVPSKATLFWSALLDLAKSYINKFPIYYSNFQKAKAANAAIENKAEPAYKAFMAPFTMLNKRGGHYLRYRYQSFPLHEFKQLSKRLDCTINNLVLALCSEAFRHYIADHEPLPTKPLVIIMPVSNRGDEGDPLFLNSEIRNNTVSLAFVPLDLRIEDFLERLQSIKHGSDLAMEQLRQTKGLRLDNFADFLPGSFFRLINWIIARQQKTKKGAMANCSISNVPGPRETLYGCNGKLKLENLLSCGNLTDQTSIGLTIWSYVDKLNFSCFFREGVLPDTDTFTHYLNQAYQQALTLAEELDSHET